MNPRDIILLTICGCAVAAIFLVSAFLFGYTFGKATGWNEAQRHKTEQIE